MEPSYLKEFESGSLEEKAEAAWEILRKCRFCPRECGVNRLEGELGFCKTGQTALVSSFGPHFGEEDPLVGQHGSGTIFFSFCNLGCIFCQNYELSHYGEGQKTSPEILARQMLHLQAIGCHNINWVTPTHVVPFLLKALLIAIPQGLCLPVVYNCGGYETLESLLFLENIVDIFMPDFKFWDQQVSQDLTQAPDYPQVARKAVKEMYRQVKDLILDNRGIAQKGLLVRHLVMPNNLAGTEEIMKFLARNISPNTYVNIMDQYRPCGQAMEHQQINRQVLSEEWEQALKWAVEAGLSRLDQRRRRRRG
ncbi:MAG: radical SAM protein [Deltaproteobacteria bacterium RBG_13_43_22]|nr:MAG: radical SAM protein [Deltaproteobacteria bacterium RBG_13_43_22]